MLERTDLSAFAAFEECKLACGAVLVTLDATFPGVRVPADMPKQFGLYVNLAFNRPNGAKDLLWDALGLTETLHHGGRWQSMYVPWAAITSIRGEAGDQPLFWLKSDRGTFRDSAARQQAVPSKKREARPVWTKNGARRLFVHAGGGQTSAPIRPALRVIEGGDPAANEDPTDAFLRAREAELVAAEDAHLRSLKRQEYTSPDDPEDGGGGRGA